MPAYSSSRCELLLPSNCEIEACKYEIDARMQVFYLHASPSKFLRLCLPSSNFLVKMLQRELSSNPSYLFSKQTENKTN